MTYNTMTKKEKAKRTDNGLQNWITDYSLFWCMLDKCRWDQFVICLVQDVLICCEHENVDWISELKVTINEILSILFSYS